MKESKTRLKLLTNGDKTSIKGGARRGVRKRLITSINIDNAASLGTCPPPEPEGE